MKTIYLKQDSLDEKQNSSFANYAAISAGQ